MEDTWFFSFGVKIFSSPKASKPAVRLILASIAVVAYILSPVSTAVT
jgi:hypothetical protein